MENGWYPKTKLANKNVPDNAIILGSMVTMSGEITTTYFRKEDKYYKVGDWKKDKPKEITNGQRRK